MLEKQKAKHLIEISKFFAIFIKNLINLLKYYCKIYFLRCQFSNFEWQFIASVFFFTIFTVVGRFFSGATLFATTLTNIVLH